MKYAIVYEKSSTGYGAYVPDLPGLGVTGRTMQLTKSRVAKAIKMYIADLREDGKPIPEPTTEVDYAEVS